MPNTSNLAAVQTEIARLVMEEGRLEAFAHDPAAHLQQAGLPAAARRLLGDVPVAGLRYFAQRRRVDRVAYLESDAPRSVHHLQERDALSAYFRRYPYSWEDPRREAARLARWAVRAGATGEIPAWVADLVTFEVAAQRLHRQPYRAARASQHPRLSPNVALLELAHNPRHFLHDHPFLPRRSQQRLALQRTAEDVELRRLTSLEFALLQGARGRLPERAWLQAAAEASGASLMQARMNARRLAGKGLLQPTVG